MEATKFEVQQSNMVGREFIQINERVLLIRDEHQRAFATNAGFLIMLDGHPIPNIEVQQADDGSWHFSLDHRFGYNITVTPEDFEQTVRLLADSMAVAAGFSCFGTESCVINIYRKYPGPTAVGEPTPLKDTNGFE